jgi:hypothetical protein
MNHSQTIALSVAKAIRSSVKVASRILLMLCAGAPHGKCRLGSSEGQGRVACLVTYGDLPNILRDSHAVAKLPIHVSP